MRVSDLKPNPQNPRHITEESFRKLKKSIKTAPWMMEIRPIIIDEDHFVLAGNMRLTAIREMKMETIPDAWVRRIDGLTDDQKREYVLRDNVTFGEWDFDCLANEWDALPLVEWGIDVPDASAVLAVEQEEDNEAKPKLVKCPNCAEEFEVTNG